MSDFPNIKSSLSEISDENKFEDSTVENEVNSNSDGEEEFYFESDHVALKNNKDYRELLKTIAILEAQRYRALTDIDTLVLLKKKVIAEPLKFVEGLSEGTIKIPEPQIIPPLPNIDWSQYNIPVSEVSKSVSGEPAAESSSINDSAKSANDKILVRGRIFDESKPETFNQLWTVEEQTRLEELLIKYPPEEIETKRWKKIAAELGNRTSKQVCSRVQKYFLKLQKAGLPVPGRAPKAHAQADLGKRSSHPYQRRFGRPTTFFPSQDVPVPLADLEDIQPISISSRLSLYDENFKGMSENVNNEWEDSTADDKVQVIMNSRKLALLRKVLEVKEENVTSHLRHSGSKCNHCEAEPIVGVLWTCETCPSVDFCTDCIVAQVESPNPHPLSHNIVPIKDMRNKKVRRYDEDYLPPSFSEPGCSYNYLDPNFMPGDDT